MQANQTRLITKCRWVIEAINGSLKQSHKALDKIQNTMLTHIIDDFKIAAALLNAFRHFLKTDGEDSEEIALNMLAKVNSKNELVKLINNKDKTSDFVSIDAIELNDFPKIELESIIKKITFGKYQITQGETYLGEHSNVNKGKILIKINRNITQIDSIKTISAEIQSRHKNRTRHKIYIKYRPNENTSDGITGWVCSCKVGLRTVGCCSHIAGIIYYLSYLKSSELPIPMPGKTLNNFLVIPTIESDDYESDDEITDSSKIKISSDNNEKKNEKIHIDLPDSNEINTLSQSMKRSCSITFENKPDKSQKKISQKHFLELNDIINNSSRNNFKTRDFVLHIPNWGGRIDTKDDLYTDYNKLSVEDTCTIDYFLLAIWCCSIINPRIKEIINLKSNELLNNLSEIVEYIDNCDWREVCGF